MKPNPIRVRFRFGDGTTVETEGYRELNLLAHAQLLERGLQSRCGGQGECGTCRVHRISGRLSALSPVEREIFEKIRLPQDGLVRLACQSFPEDGLVELDVPSERFRDARAGKRKRET